MRAVSPHTRPPPCSCRQTRPLDHDELDARMRVRLSLAIRLSQRPASAASANYQGHQEQYILFEAHRFVDGGVSLLERRSADAGALPFIVCQPVLALGETIHIEFQNRTLGDYIAGVSGPLGFGRNITGLALLVTGETDEPTVEVPKHIFFGRVDAEMRSAPGPGIVTTLTLVSPDQDEVSFEWTGANDKTVQTSFFSKGNNTLYDRILYHPVDTSSTKFHTYSFSWGTRWLQWLVDGNVIRTINYRKEDDGTSNGFPYGPAPANIPPPKSPS